MGSIYKSLLIINASFCIFQVVSSQKDEVLQLENHTSYFSPKELQEGYAAAYFMYTAIGWDYEEINSTILGLNLDRIDSMPENFNSSIIDSIYIYPEHTLTTTEVLKDRDLAIALSQRVPDPDPNTTLCKVGSEDPDDLAVTRLSCVSFYRFVYTVIGILEKEPCEVGVDGCRDDGLKIYSTTVVFGKNGEIVAKYRKFHLIDEPALDPAPSQEAVTFTTESQVTFGLLTGHDLFYYQPRQSLQDMGIVRFILNGAWRNKMPFQFATSYHMAWVQSYGANLLAANYMRAELGYAGTGYYFSNGDYSIQMAYTSGGFSLIDVESEAMKEDITKKQNVNARELIMDTQDLSEWWSVPVYYKYNELTHVQVCHGEEFCCNLEYRMRGATEESYFQLLAFDGIRKDLEGNELYAEQTCGLVACAGTDISTCGADKIDILYAMDVLFVEIRLYASFSTSKVVPYTILGDDSYFPMGFSNLTIVPEGDRFNATYENLWETIVHVIAITSLDYLSVPDEAFTQL